MRAKTAGLTTLLFLVSCNQPPGAAVVTIEPLEPTTIDDLVAVITSEAPDEDGDTISYSYAWYLNTDTEVQADTDSVDGGSTTKHETWKVVIIPSDGELIGPSSEARVVIGNSLPEADVTLGPEAPLTTDLIVATASGWDLDNDLVELDYTWLVGDAISTCASAILPADATARGEVWTVEVTPRDEEGPGVVATAQVSIENTLPVMTDATLAPDDVYEESTLEVEAQANDDDGDPVSFDYAWYVDDSLVQDSELASLDGASFDKHQQVRVEITPSDEFAAGEPLELGPVTILNSLPSVGYASVVPGALLESSIATCDPFAWSDDDPADPEQPVLSWSVNGVVVASSETLDGGSFSRGDVVSCTLTPCDDDGCGPSVTSEDVVVGNTAPSLASALLSTSAPAEADTISVILGAASDDDDDALEYSYSWVVNGTAVSTSATLDGGIFDRGDNIVCEVTPDDGTDQGLAVTTDTAVAVNTAPLIATVSLMPSEPITSDVVIVSVTASDADGDTVTLGYTWFVDSSAVSVTGSSLDGDLWFDKGQQIQVTVTSHDGLVSGSSVSSSAIVVLNDLPSPPTVSISPAEPMPGDTLLCEMLSGSTDDDGDSISYSFAWTVDDVAYSGASTTTHSDDTVPGFAVGQGEYWTCAVTASDLEGAGEPGTDTVLSTLYEGWSSRSVDASTADYMFSGTVDSSYMQGVAGADVDGDGLADLIMGSGYVNSTADNAGAVYLFLAAGLGSDTSLSTSEADCVVQGSEEGERLGYYVYNAGDVDGDAIDDVLMAAPHDADYRGGVYLYSGSSLGQCSGTMSTADADWTFTAEASNDAAYVTSAGPDWDGDGLADPLFGAPYNDDADTDSGKAYLYLSSSIATQGTYALADADYVFYASDSGDHLGTGVTNASDLDADGIEDLAIGASYSNYGDGAAYVFRGASLSSPGSYYDYDADYCFESDYYGGRLDVSTGVGDTDGDGYGEVLLFAYYAYVSSAGINPGKAYLVSGADLSSSSCRDVTGMASHTFVGDSHGEIGGKTYRQDRADIDGDGLFDILTAACYDDAGGTDAGAAYLFLAGNLGSGGTYYLDDADHSFIGESADDEFGLWSAFPGDVNGDGLEDVLMSAFMADAGGSNRGRAYLFLTP